VGRSQRETRGRHEGGGEGAAQRAALAPSNEDASCGYARPCTVRADNSLKMRFSVTLGEEPDMDVELA
jgi:hypothetical protein